MPHRISACLWFDGQAEEAAKFYTSIFKDGKITNIIPFPDVGREIHGGKPGSTMVVTFELNGQSFTALNGGPQFKFNEAISLQIDCVDQAEIDYLWDKLGDGGDPAKQNCGWLADKYGVSWQVVPKVLDEMIADPDKEKSQRAFLAMLEMQKIDIAALERAFAG
jgi:predicted 3-demethylubiquinone-9 3-methyltransferase (glyoxalase superfamily)